MNYRKRHLETRFQQLRQVSPVLLITGARQVGKSTMLKELVGTSVPHIVFDPVVDVGNARRDPELFLSEHTPPLALDEVQYAPELLPVIKRRVDQHDTPGQYFLTGSQNLALLKNVSESLAGRVVVMNLLPLSLAERCGCADKIRESWVNDLFEEDAVDRLRVRQRLPPRDLEPALFSRVWRGGMPRLIDLPDDLLPDLFSSYVQTYVERDLRRMADVSDQQLFTRFLSLCAALTGQEVNHSQLGRELGISPQTANRWLSLLRATYQWIEVPPYHGNAVKRLSQRPKGYMTDSGLAAYLQFISSPKALSGHPALGALFETHAATDIIKHLTVGKGRTQVLYWRSHGGAEVDLILERDSVFVPIEMKSAARVTIGDARGIIAFRQTYPALRHGPGIIVAAVEEVSLLTNDIVVVPYDIA